ncbi:hypothetical protein [Singulisphaera sp. GP187]|uniref:GAP1-M domain-containing protein n=1 Tax=Singulisphaera sp. GP187 TaxID=1882752 RepID=UPI0020B14D37|nr:hypothetical protein [Singulisphaera sp. GP187]
MKQIYYTQCPIGYGLGASNGFQIKRLTPGYPISGDFRHLGLRAFLAGTRTMAPAALRYRRNERGEAEVAWLSPRSHEYETERGLWGRPGGHFAHGFLLEDRELETLGNWPAGLFDRPLWIRSDRFPSRGEPPAPLELGAADLSDPPGFDVFDKFVPGGDPSLLACLLTSLATVVREGRTLFLIDDAERLADRIALLTLAFPAAWRPALTFSTYHDRPEELPGFRLQGSIHAARPNRQALFANGIVADLGSGVIEPRLEPAAWARTMADWLIRRTAADRWAWEETGRRAELARAGRDLGAHLFWTDEWLNQLYGFDRLVHLQTGTPALPQDWADLASLTAWANRHGLAEELVETRPHSWWREAAAVGSNEARLALREHLAQSSVWTAEDAPAAWGETIADWSRTLGPEARFSLIEAALGSAPAAARPGFVRALIGMLPDPEAREALRWLESLPSSDRALLLPLGVRNAVVDALENQDTRPIRSLLGQAFNLPESLPAVLDALAAEASTAPSAREEMAGLLARALEPAGSRTVAIVLRWALRQGELAKVWLKPFLRRAFADPMNQAGWQSLHKLVPAPLQRCFATAVLEIARDSTLPDDAFCWGVEQVLLPLPEANRPCDSAWAGVYLDRTPSGLDLLKRLFSKEYRQLGLSRWVEQARARGELSDAQQTRILECEQYARVLRTGDARSLLNIKLPVIPATERGAILGQILRHMGGGLTDALHLALDTCRDSWPGAFDAGQPGLAGLARALAEPLLDARADPTAWFDQLVGLLDRLGLTTTTGGGDDGFEANSLAAEISAELMRRPGPGFDVWSTRQFLLQNDRAWRLLAADVRRELVGKSIPARLESLQVWDKSLTKGMHTGRFFEVWLNVCDGPTLAATVAARAADLKSLGSILWWHANDDPDACHDLRDAFATLSPMAPLPEDGLTAVQNWMRPNRPAQYRADDEGLALPDSPGHAASRAPGESPFLSRQGAARWRCLEALSALYRTGIGSTSCWQSLAGWKHVLPLGELETADRYRFVAWFIFRVDEFEPFQIARFAKWLFECGLSDVDRLTRWAEELGENEAVSDAIKLARAPLVGDLRMELRQVIRDAREPARKMRSPDSPPNP